MDLKKLLDHVDKVRDSRIWKQTADMDDAGALHLTDGRLLFQSIDVMTPPCDDPVLFGRIAAANALSDLYARAVTPLSALHLLAYPVDKLSADIIAQILLGSQSVLQKAGVALLGGHTLKDQELKYGLAVTGIADENEVVPMGGAKPGDALVITKPIGTGLAVDLFRKGRIHADVFQSILESMAETNCHASILMKQYKAHAATDITGFGLAGHALHLANASGVNLLFHCKNLPIYTGLQQYFNDGFRAGAAEVNYEYVRESLVFPPQAHHTRSWESILADPQTSGGLLIAFEVGKAEQFIEHMRDLGHEAWLVGETKPMDSGKPRIILDSIPDKVI